MTENIIKLSKAELSFLLRCVAVNERQKGLLASVGVNIALDPPPTLLMDKLRSAIIACDSSGKDPWTVGEGQKLLRIIRSDALSPEDFELEAG